MNKKMAALFAIIFLAGVSTPAGKSPQTEPGKNSPVFAFINVNVIPMDRARVLKNQIVIVRDGRIAEIGDAGRIKAPKEAQAVDGRGKYLIPGLIDMHTHLFSDEDFPDSLAGDELAVMVANGVTTIRLMIGRPEHLALRAKIAKGELHGPSIYIASPEFTGRRPGGIFNGRSVATPVEARTAVRECKAAGYDFIKLTTHITRPVYDAVIETAKAEGIRVVGHVDTQVGLYHALAAEQQIEHLDSYMEAVLRDDSPIKVSVSDVGVGRKPNWVSLDYIDERKVDAAIKATAHAGVYSTPTLTFFKLSFAVEQSESDLRARPDYRFFPPKLRESRLAAHRRYWTDPPTPERRQRYISIRNRLVKGIHDAGGKIMAGSDTPELFLLYGYTLHRELQNLVEAGLTPYAALASATRTPAEYLLDACGTIEHGKRADLVLLEANPLDDIRNTEKRAGVMLRGRWLPDTELKKTLDEIAVRFQQPLAAAEQPRVGPSANANWPQWRGLDSQGISQEKDLPTEWSTTKNVKWKMPIAGRGHSSPIIWGDRVFLTTAIEGDVIPGAKPPKHILGGGAYVHPDSVAGNRNHTLKVLCLDRRSGKLLWERTAYSGRVYDDRHRTATNADATPATDGRYLYAWFGSEGLYCYDLDGKLVWKKTLGNIPTQGMGNGTSPVLYENLIILQCDEDNGERSFIVALDKKTGKDVWRTPRQVQVSWSTPVIARAPAGTELVASGAEYVAGYDPLTGKELWRCEGTGSWTVSTPLVGHGIAIFSAAHPVKRAIAVRLGGSGDITGTPQVVWQRDKGTGYTPSSILYGDYAYLLTDGGILTCIDVKTGEVKYEGARAPRPGRFYASPVAFEDKILLMSETGDAFVLKAGLNHEVLQTNSLDEPIYASPAIAGGNIFIRGMKHIYCIGAGGGK